MITTRAHRLTKINQGCKQLNKNNTCFSKSYNLSQTFSLLHRFLQSRMIEKEIFPVLEYTKTSAPISYERSTNQSPSTIASSQKTGNFKQ